MATSSGDRRPPQPLRQTRVGQLDQSLDFAAAAVLLGMLGWAVLGFSRHLDCKPDPVTGLESFALVSACAAGFVLGRGMSHLLDVQQSRQPGTRYVDRWLTAGWARILVQAGVVLFLVTATGLLVYETYGLDPLNRAWPITSYVRCATHLNGALGFVLCAFGGGFFCFIVGHWLWYPSRRESE